MCSSMAYEATRVRGETEGRAAALQVPSEASLRLLSCGDELMELVEERF